MKSFLLELAALATILLVGAFFRFQHLDWDQGYLFHPDERQILLVASKLQLPASLADFFSPASPLNPQFFSYGSLPLYLLRAISPLAPPVDIPSTWQDPHYIALAFAGRAVSALFDLGTLIFIYLLGRMLYDARVGIVASAAYAVTVLAVQLAHFYAVDTLLTFFTTATIFFVARYARLGRPRDLVTQGIFFGLALATKISALPLLVPIIYALTLVAARQGKRARTVSRQALSSTIPRAFQDYWEMIREPFGLIASLALVVFFVTQPYALIDLTHFVGDLYRETLIARGWLDVPYTRQYVGTLPFIYQIQQSTVWGFGLPLGIFAWGGALLFAFQWYRARDGRDSLILLWATTYFLVIGGQQVKYLRYLLPLAPFLLLMATCALIRAHDSLRGPRANKIFAGWFPAIGIVLALGGGLGWTLAFSSIYAGEHAWLQASDWIYANVPRGATLVIEQWDEPLPVLRLDNGIRREATQYHILQNPIFDAEDSTKTERLVKNLSDSDYVVLASPRGFGAIPRLGDRYPITTRYYEALFDGRLGFEPVYSAQVSLSFANNVFEQDPFADTDLIPSFANSSDARVWNLGPADESFSVYDHPLTIIFKKTRALSADDLRRLLTSR